MDEDKLRAKQLVAIYKLQREHLKALIKQFDEQIADIEMKLTKAGL